MGVVHNLKLGQPDICHQKGAQDSDLDYVSLVSGSGSGVGCWADLQGPDAIRRDLNHRLLG